MAVYKWRIPMLSAVQFNGKNYDEVKELIGDDSGEKEKFMLHTGEYEEEPAVSGRKKHHHKKAAAEPQAGEGEEQPQQGEGPDSRGVSGDAELEPPPEPPKEKLEELSVSEGDWVTKDVANGKVEVNPEGFPDKYEFISG
jgi:hypothetical protein